MYKWLQSSIWWKGSWIFNDDSTWNVIIFRADNSSSSDTHNLKNDFQILGKGDTFGINGSYCAPEKTFDINFSKAKTKFCLSFHYNADNSYLFVNGKEICKFKARKEDNNFLSQLCLGSISDKFEYVDSEEVSLKENAYYFSLDYNAIDKTSILNIHKFLIGKNNIK